MWKEGELLETGVFQGESQIIQPEQAVSPIRLIDKLMISVGMLFRIQTVVIFVVLLFVEYDNDCRVVKGASEPLKYETLIQGVNGEQTNVRDIQRLFNFILLAIFSTSLLSSILYIKKTLLYIKLKKTPNAQKTLYKLIKNRYRKAQVLQIAVMCGTQLAFVSNEPQVCSGWFIGFNPIEVVSKILELQPTETSLMTFDPMVYLINRGFFINFIGVCGLILLISMTIVESQRIKRKRRKLLIDDDFHL